MINISNKSGSDQKDYYKNNILYFNEKIAKNNKESLNFLSRGIFYCLTEDYGKTMNDLQKAIDLNGTNALIYFARANCKIKMNELLEQVNMNTDRIQIPLRAGPSQKENQTSQMLADYTEVIGDYTKCLQINDKFPYAYFNLAYVRCKTHDYEGALADLNKAIEIEKDFAEAYFNRGLTRIYLDDINGGAMDLSKAGELGIQDAYNIIKRYCN
jgi:tetratricopeptide (TPR) repeat protein